MEIILLHSAQVEDSRALLSELGLVETMEVPADFTLMKGSSEVRVISKHALATGVCPSFSCYPTLVVKEGDQVRSLSGLKTWAEAVDFINEPPATVTPVQKVRFSKLEFLGLLTDAEKVSLKAKETSDPVVGVFWEEFRASEFIDLTDPRTIRGVQALEASDNLDEGRAAQILAGEAPAR